MASSVLPTWVQWVQAVALIALPIVGAWIAAQQVFIGRAKLRLDLFDRRFAVLEAVRAALGLISAHANLTQTQERAFSLGTFDAAFLFDDDLAAYLEDMRKRIFRLQTHNEMIGGPDHQTAVKAKFQEVRWFSDQRDVVQRKFAPFLKLRG